MGNPIIAALQHASADLQGLDTDGTKRHAEALTAAEAEEALFLVQAILDGARRETDRLRRYYEDGPGNDAATAERLRKLVARLADVAGVAQ